MVVASSIFLISPDRHAADKRKVWDDIKEVIRVLNGEITPRPNSGGPAGGRDLSG